MMLQMLRLAAVPLARLHAAKAFRALCGRVQSVGRRPT